MVRKPKEVTTEEVLPDWVYDPIHKKVPLRWFVDDRKGIEGKGWQVGHDFFFKTNRKLWLSQYPPDFINQNIPYEIVNSMGGDLAGDQRTFELEEYYKANGYCHFCFHTLTGLKADKGIERTEGWMTKVNYMRYKCYILSDSEHPTARIIQKNRRTGQKTFIDYPAKTKQVFYLVPCIHQFLTF